MFIGVNMDAFEIRRQMRLLVLKYLLNLEFKETRIIEIDLKDMMDVCKINRGQAGRSLGDLNKGLKTLSVVLRPDDFTPIFRIYAPNLKQVAAALEIAMTDGDCTSWNPETV